MRKLKVMTIVGTRPEIIRLSRVIEKLDRHCEHVLVHTGQNYDHQLSQVFFDELGLRAPDRYLGVDTSSLARVLAGTLIFIDNLDFLPFQAARLIWPLALIAYGTASAWRTILPSCGVQLGCNSS